MAGFRKLIFIMACHLSPTWESFMYQMVICKKPYFIPLQVLYNTIMHTITIHINTTNFGIGFQTTCNLTRRAIAAETFEGSLNWAYDSQLQVRLVGSRASTSPGKPWCKCLKNLQRHSSITRIQHCLFKTSSWCAATLFAILLQLLLRIPLPLLHRTSFPCWFTYCEWNPLVVGIILEFTASTFMDKNCKLRKIRVNI